MYTDPCTIALQTDNQLITMQEIKFNIYGENFYPNGFSRMDILSYIAATREDALATCKRLNPGFHVMGIWIDESIPEVVKLQPLR
jgi:hypothetical protein